MKKMSKVGTKNPQGRHKKTLRFGIKKKPQSWYKYPQDRNKIIPRVGIKMGSVI